MTKWEYLTIVASYYKTGDNWEWYATWANGARLKDAEQKILLPQRLKLLGQDGWELVSEYVDPGRPRFEYNFFYVSGRMKPFTVDGKQYNQNNWGEYLDYLGQYEWELVSSIFEANQSIFGTPQGLFIFKRLFEGRVRRLQFKRPLP